MLSTSFAGITEPRENTKPSEIMKPRENRKREICLCNLNRDGPGSENLGGKVVMWGAATTHKRLLFCQNMGDTYTQHLWTKYK